MNIKRIHDRHNTNRPEMDQWAIEGSYYWRALRVDQQGHRWLNIDYNISAPTLRECVSKVAAIERSYHVFQYNHMGNNG